GGDPEAGGDRTELAVRHRHVAPRNRRTRTIGEAGAARRIRAGQHEREFLAAPAAGHVALAHRGPARVRERGQDVVAGRMAEAITSEPKSELATRSGNARRSVAASGSPARASSPPGPMTTPPAAPVASTADSTATRISCSGSWVATSVSPNRAVALRTRLRS